MALAIRTMQKTDIPLGLELCREAGWNQLEADWRRLLTLSPEEVFVGEYKGHPCGTASATSYGTATAWIGMVLVRSDWRRRGIGSALMKRCIDHLRDKGVETIRIDATDQGRPVYLKLGFDDERPIHRYAGPRPSPLEENPAVKPVNASLWPLIAECDGVAFGADRLRLLKLFGEQDFSAVLTTAEGAIKGYGFARRGFEASYIGPIVAVDSHTARLIILKLFGDLPEGPVLWDILPDNVAAKDMAASLGFRVQRRLTRMHLGKPLRVGDLNVIYGTAGFELG